MKPRALITTPLQLQEFHQAQAGMQGARRSGQAWAVAESNLRMARWYREVGLLDFSLTLLEDGLAAASGADQQVELLCESVNTLAQWARSLELLAPGSGRDSRDEARRRVAEISRLAQHLADAKWEAKVLMHLSEVLNRFGDKDDAVKLQNRAMQLMAAGTQERSPTTFNPCVLPGLGRLADM